MVLFNYSTKELTAKIVYYGPGLCGKTTNLQWIHEKVPIKNKGKMLSLATETDRTLFFDFLPIELGTIRGMKTRIQLYTVPGQVFYNATRRMVLKGADSVVFVCDSQDALVEANLESMENLRQNLEANEINPDEIPMVLQYNKRDLPNALPIEILNERLNPRNYPYFEAVAIKGVGVEETLKGITAHVFRSLSTKYGVGEAVAVEIGQTPAPASGAFSPAPSKPAGPTPAPAPPPKLAPPPPPPQAPPKAVPQPVKPAMPTPPAPPASLPPIRMNKGSEPPEDLLDSLDLTPAPEGDGASEQDIGLGESAPIEVEMSDDIESIALAPPPKAPDIRATTMVSAARDGEIIRQKLRGGPPPAQVNPQPEEVLEDLDIESDLEPLTPVRPIRAPLASSVSNQPAMAARHLQTLQVDVTAAKSQAPTEISVPIDIAVEPGTRQIRIQLNLTLNLK
jgi:hypothetical protein